MYLYSAVPYVSLSESFLSATGKEVVDLLISGTVVRKPCPEMHQSTWNPKMLIEIMEIDRSIFSREREERERGHNSKGKENSLLLLLLRLQILRTDGERKRERGQKEGTEWNIQLPFWSHV